MIVLECGSLIISWLVIDVFIDKPDLKFLASRIPKLESGHRTLPVIKVI